jgi:hypothetical protein
MSAGFINDIISYCDPADKNSHDKQVFAGFIKPDNTTGGSTLHPSALEVFRLADIFPKTSLKINDKLVDNVQLGKLLHQLIGAYNQ